jgi:hypothetical protein
MKTNMKLGQTTLGELIAFIMDAASRFTRDEREAYRITGLIMNRMLCPVPAVARRRGAKPQRRPSAH